MKRDWSVIRITILLYLVAFLLPLNYYFAKQSFQSTKNDASTMKNIVFISGSVQHLSVLDEKIAQEVLIKDIDASFKYIDKSFINYPSNIEYIKLFRADESYHILTKTYNKLKDISIDKNVKKVLASEFLEEVNRFSRITQDMMNYKLGLVLNKLYISLASTMFVVIALIFLVRFYIKLQIKKHAVHDHVTGLYNRKYFDNILKHEEALSNRQKQPLSLLLLNITNYQELQSSFDSETVDKQIKEFARIFSSFFRHSDIVCRIEDSSFVAITPNVTLENEKIVLHRLKDELKLQEIDIDINLHITTGISVYDYSDTISLLEKAKFNMDNSKEQNLGGVR